MAAELEKAIVAKAKADSALNSAVSGRIYYGEAGSDAMPYIIFDIVTVTKQKTFRPADCWDEALVRFRIFDADRSVQNIESIYDKLVAVFDRAVLTYDTRTAIGCERVSASGPLRLEDCWMMTVDYLVSVQ